MLFRWLWGVFVLLLLGAGARADQLVMHNGSLLIGTLVSADDKGVVFNTPFAGDITIARGTIKTIVTDGNVDLLMRDGTVYRDKRIVAQGEDLVVLSDEARPVRFDAPDIRLVNPEPWRLGEGYKWFGRFNTALQSERGNTDTDELDLELESIWRSLEDRYTLRAEWEIDESNGERNKYRWLLRDKYDRFSREDPDNYVGFQLVASHDQFADLDLRTGLGPYLGRQFFEHPYLTLHAELGLVYVDEQFDMAEDNDFWGSNWEVRLSSEVIRGLEFYLDQTGVYNFVQSSDLILNTTAGLRFPLIFGFEAAAEAVYEYDGGAVEGVDTTDETYKFKLGYRW
ncbi:MAG: hypothetical protein CME59_01515 [Halioglobus sp.]|nr:hypothetical protein [Halioglobus sp.]|tara:strand:+ start:1478 stop:2497 length:1020 start_codon:yes stop_codon:yes gene_type:complete